MNIRTAIILVLSCCLISQQSFTIDQNSQSRTSQCIFLFGLCAATYLIYKAVQQENDIPVQQQMNNNTPTNSLRHTFNGFYSAICSFWNRCWNQSSHQNRITPTQQNVSSTQENTITVQHAARNQTIIDLSIDNDDHNSDHHIHNTSISEQPVVDSTDSEEIASDSDNVSDQAQKPNCPICLDEITEPYILPCGNNHQMCVECAQSWANTHVDTIPFESEGITFNLRAHCNHCKPQCPLCKKDLNRHRVRADLHIEHMQ